MTIDAPARLPPGLVSRVRQAFRLDWNGIHGAGHWARVAYHGRHLARAHGISTLVPHLFALLHDSQRCHEGWDRNHGPRAAWFVRQLQEEGFLDLPQPDLDLLMMACEGHSAGTREAPLIVQVCWDADRLDLGRVGIRPEPKRLCTVPARDPGYLAFAWAWSTMPPAKRKTPCRVGRIRDDVREIGCNGNQGESK